MPDEAILKEVQGRTTYESLAATARFLATTTSWTSSWSPTATTPSGSRASPARSGWTPHVSGVDMDGPTIAQLSRETGAVALGRVIGYRRLTNLVD